MTHPVSDTLVPALSARATQKAGDIINRGIKEAIESGSNAFVIFECTAKGDVHPKIAPVKKRFNNLM